MVGWSHEWDSLIQVDFWILRKKVPNTQVHQTWFLTHINHVTIPLSNILLDTSIRLPRMPGVYFLGLFRNSSVCIFFCREFTRVIIFTWTMSSIVLISSWRHLFCSLSRIISKLRSSLLILGFGLSSSSEISEGARSAREDISDWPSIEEGSHNEVSVSKNTL